MSRTPRNTKLCRDVAAMPDGIGSDEGHGADGHKGAGKDGHLRLNFASFCNTERKSFLKLGSLQLRHKGYKGSMKGKEVDPGKLVFRPAFSCSTCMLLYHSKPWHATIQGKAKGKLHQQLQRGCRNALQQLAVTHPLPGCTQERKDSGCTRCFGSLSARERSQLGLRHLGSLRHRHLRLPGPEKSLRSRQRTGCTHLFLIRTVNIILQIVHACRIQKMTRKAPTRDDLRLLQKQAACPFFTIRLISTNIVISLLSCPQ